MQNILNNMKYILTLGLFSAHFLLLSAQDLSYSAQLAAAQQAYDQADYQTAGEQLKAAFAERSPRSEEMQLALRAWTLAEQAQETFPILENGINSGWLTIDLLLGDTLLTPLHTSPEWQTLIQKLIRYSNGSNEQLRSRVATLLERDQYYRQQMQNIARDKGWQDPTIKEMHGLQQELDVINLQEVDGIISEFGYPGRSLVGSFSATALYIIQRADLATQEKYLPILKQAAEEHEILRSEMAYLIDKMRITKEEPQVYGTQIIRSSNGLLDFYRIEAPEQVNQRRYEVGLLPIEEYAEKVGVRY